MQNIIKESGCHVPGKADRVRIEPLHERDVEYVAQMCAYIFEQHDTMASEPLKIAYFTEVSISYKAIVNGQIIGCYLMNEDGIYLRDGFVLHEDLSPYYGRKSLHGVILAVLPEYQGTGIGRQLRDLPLTSGKYDYIWGFHAKSLNNIDNWCRYGRRLVGESDANYMTLMDLKLPVICRKIPGAL